MLYQSRSSGDRGLAPSSGVLTTKGLHLSIQIREYHGLTRGPTREPFDLRMSFCDDEIIVFR